MTTLTALTAGCVAALGLALGADDTIQAPALDDAVTEEIIGPVELPDGSVRVDDLTWPSWEAYLTSDYFRENGLRCGFEASTEIDGGSPSDCSFSFTNPSDEYDPSVVKWRIPVVVHVIRNSTGTLGHISESMVQSQIDILNEDFLALAGSFGADGTDVQVEFFLATEDPSGNPTNGITYSNNTTWYNDQGGYYVSLAWDTNRYLNIYTNQASGALGYVPDLPQGGIVGSSADRVVIFWRAFGRSAPIGPPYNQGRTATHEVGHYLGLYHTFQSGCGTSACYSTGDRICDTPAESSPRFGCPIASSCGSIDPTDNYMDYTDDLCMERFTPEQSRRIRCTMTWYRPNLAQLACTPADGDVDGSGTVDVEDLLGVLADWGCTATCSGDSNCDGTVDVTDLLEVLGNWG